MRRRIAPAAVVLMLALAGCGDAGLDLNELQTRANAICQRADRELRALPRPRDTAAIRVSVRRSAVITRRAIAALEDLEPPAELRERYAKLLENLRSQVTLATQRLNAILARDRARAVRATEQGDRLARDNDALTRAIGTPKCGSD